MARQTIPNSGAEIEKELLVKCWLVREHYSLCVTQNVDACLSKVM